MTTAGRYDDLRNPLCRRPAGEHDESCNCGRDGYIIPAGRDAVRNPKRGVSVADFRDYPTPCNRVHVVPDGQDCDEHDEAEFLARHLFALAYDDDPLTWEIADSSLHRTYRHDAIRTLHVLRQAGFRVTRNG